MGYTVPSSAETVVATPMRYRVATEGPNAHHVFAVELGVSQYWRLDATYEDRKVAERHARCSMPHGNTLFVDLTSNRVIINGKATRLRARPAEVLSILSSRFGRRVTNEALMTLVWGSNDDTDHYSSLKVHICTLRRVLEGTPFCIETMRSSGYTLKERDKQ